MKCFEVVGDIVEAGIPVTTEAPYPRIVLGEGGHKRATWIALGRRDVDGLLAHRMAPCPKRRTSEYYFDIAPQTGQVCEMCGQKYGSPERKERLSDKKVYFTCAHPDDGQVESTTNVVLDAGAIKLPPKEGKSEAFLIVVPRPGADNRAMVLWRVASGYRGGASIKAGEGVVVIGNDSAWASGRGSLGETAEMLAILAPGQELRATYSGRRVQGGNGRLTYDGKTINVLFGGDELDAATAETVEGEYL